MNNNFAYFFTRLVLGFVCVSLLSTGLALAQEPQYVDYIDLPGVVYAADPHVIEVDGVWYLYVDVLMHDGGVPYVVELKVGRGVPRFAIYAHCHEYHLICLENSVFSRLQSPEFNSCSLCSVFLCKNRTRYL